jgi:hypothetical protein
MIGARIFAHLRTKSKLSLAWVPAWSRSLASLASGAGMTKWSGQSQATP